MKTRALFLILLFCLGLVAPLPAQTASHVEKRFLFIVETSSETKKSAANIRESLLALLGSGMGGLMEDGDTFGIWTFNSELHPAKMGVQTWKTSASVETVQRVGDFLKLQRYEKSPKLDIVSRTLFPVIKNSPTITVVLMTSGKNPLQGTPFDREINEFFKANTREFQQKKVPFLTMLLAQNGTILRHSTGPAIGDVKIPKPLPPAPVVAQKPKPAPVVPAVTNETKTTTAPVATTDKALVISKSGTQRIPASAVAEKFDATFVNLLKTNDAAVATPAQPVAAQPVSIPAVTNETKISETIPETPKIQPDAAPEKMIVSTPEPPVLKSPEKIETAVSNPEGVETARPEIVKNSTVAPENNIEDKANFPAPQAAVAAVQSEPNNPNVFLYAAIALMLAGVVLAFLIGRHSFGKRPKQSIISDSLDPKK